MKVSIYLTFILISSLLLISCSDLKENINSPQMVSLHKDGILSSSSADWHGNLVKNSKNSLNECRSCHGKDLTGYTDAPSCTKCHQAMSYHTEGFKHSKIMSDLTWNLSFCQQCHGEDYAGTATSPGCLTCHTSNRGPQACNTCHGEFATAGRNAPPADLSGNTETTARGVGAHTKHLYENDLSEINCWNCHPSFSYGFAGHIDGLPAEIQFDSLANGITMATYDANGNLECSNTYCHGNFEFLMSDSEHPLGYADSLISGNNKTVVWNEVGTDQAECGSCHGLPPEGHSSFAGTIVGKESCNTCHSKVVDKNGNILDKSLHINGRVD